MTKRLLGVLSFAAVSILALSQAAKATPIAPGDDPAFVETVTNSCPANCGSVALATDPFPGGLTTVRYTFNSTIPSVVAGDVKIAGVWQFNDRRPDPLRKHQRVGSRVHLLHRYRRWLGGRRGTARLVRKPTL